MRLNDQARTFPAPERRELSNITSAFDGGLEPAPTLPTDDLKVAVGDVSDILLALARHHHAASQDSQ